MAFVQKLSSTSVKSFATSFTKSQGATGAFTRLSSRSHLALVDSEDTDTPRHFQNAAMAFNMPKQARSRAAELQRLQNAMLAQLNKSLPAEVRLTSGSILPPEAFQNDLGRFLMLACDFYAASPENTYVTPPTEVAAEFIGLPFVPANMPDVLRSNALSKLQWLREAVAIDHHRTSVALQQGDISQLLKSNDRKLAYRQELESIVQGLAVARCGASTWDAHEWHFRSTILGL
jgi:hypothetical protein